MIRRELAGVDRHVRSGVGQGREVNVIRVAISLSEADDAWLTRQARQKGVSASEIVRQALQLLRDQEELDGGVSFDEAPDSAGETWSQDEGGRWESDESADWEGEDD